LSVRGVYRVMVLSDHLPTFVWLWRRMTSIRLRPRRIALCFATFLVIVALAPRIASGIFEYRVLEIVNGLAQIRLDQTTKAELLKTVADLKPGTSSYGKCPEEECFSNETYIWSSSFGAMEDYFFGRWVTQGRFHSKVGYWLGYRVTRFSADVELSEGRVHKLYFSLMVSNGNLWIDRTVLVNVSGIQGFPFGRVLWSVNERDFSDGRLPEVEDESPDYRVTSIPIWKGPANAMVGLSVAFTPGAPAQLARHAFELQLNCIWRLNGCTSTRDLLPLAWEDKLRIESAALARMKSSNPCPDRILPRRARDSPDIILAEVTRLLPSDKNDLLGECRRADFRLVQVLKGKLNRKLEGVLLPIRIGTQDPNLRIPNPVIPYVRPGSKLLMFSENYEPCQIVAATPSALGTIQSALASLPSKVAQNDRWWW
jgi:hypothetical protein